MIAGVQKAGSTLLGFLITRGLDRLRARDTTFRPRDGINACPNMEEVYENQSPEVGPVHLPICRPTGLFNLKGRSEPGLWKSYSELMRNSLMNANSYKSNKSWQSAPTASASMRSTPGLNIGVFNFGDLGRSGGVGRLSCQRTVRNLPSYQYSRD